jgi:hypothetical protein
MATTVSDGATRISKLVPVRVSEKHIFFEMS